MKLVFITNLMNHHQKPIADWLYAKYGDSYHYVITKPLPEIFVKVGYSNFDNTNYVISYYEEHNKEYIRSLVIEADVVIMGGVYVEELVELRLKQGGLLLFYSERWHKRLISYLAVPIRYISGYIYKRFMRFNNHNVYMLCSSAFVPNDCRWEHAFKNKTYKWGYFPPFEELDIEDVIKNKRAKKEIDILFVARSLKLKHPELAIESVLRLKNMGYNVFLTMVGGVYDEDSNSQYVFDMCKKAEKEHPDTIAVLGSVKNEIVKQLMRETDIFYFTSDRNEGWGAVLNEAMSSGCACVVSDMIGSSRYLIEDGINGMLFKNKNVYSLVEKTKLLLDTPSLRYSISENAYNTIREKWQPIKAAERLANLCSSLLKGQDTSYTDGPCSKAYPVKNKLL